MVKRRVVFLKMGNIRQRHGLLLLTVVILAMIIENNTPYPKLG